jgi:hypothetical protein
MAYIEFRDENDLEMLEMSFDNYKVQELNGAEIDRLDNFDWTSLPQSGSKNSSNDSSDKAEDLTQADQKNLILIKNCDSSKLSSMSNDEIKKVFGEFSSVNRIVKKDNEVIVEFLNENDIDLLEMKFDNMNIPQLG